VFPMMKYPEEDSGPRTGTPSVNSIVRDPSR
jgi:hypothetical protein